MKIWLSTKGVLDEGLRWRVGDGRSIKVWEDKWLPDSVRSKITSRLTVDCDITKVNELMEEQEVGWKQDVVEQLFSPQETRQILQIPLSYSEAGDQLLWQPEKHILHSTICLQAGSTP